MEKINETCVFKHVTDRHTERWMVMFLFKNVTGVDTVTQSRDVGGNEEYWCMFHPTSTKHADTELPSFDTPTPSDTQTSIAQSAEKK